MMAGSMGRLLFTFSQLHPTTISRISNLHSSAQFCALRLSAKQNESLLASGRVASFASSPGRGYLYGHVGFTSFRCASDTARDGQLDDFRLHQNVQHIKKLSAINEGSDGNGWDDLHFQSLNHFNRYAWLPDSKLTNVPWFIGQKA